MRRWSLSHTWIFVRISCPSSFWHCFARAASSNQKDIVQVADRIETLGRIERAQEFDDTS